MKIAFISDLHLSPQTSEANQVFYNLMQKWKNELDALYILGDFFDYWLGDDDDNDFINQIKVTLKHFSLKAPIYFIGGNHDFGIGKKFAKETGISILKDCTLLNVNNYRILLSHGDVFCSLDIGYQRMKKILQNPITMFILRKIPLSWRYKLKDMLKNKSSSTSYNPYNQHIYQVVDNTVAQFAKKYKADVVIHGHTHKPNYYHVKLDDNIVITRIKIPDWVNRKPGGYVILEDTTIKIYDSNGIAI